MQNVCVTQFKLELKLHQMHSSLHENIVESVYFVHGVKILFVLRAGKNAGPPSKKSKTE
jgi:hypothetical protein